MDVIETDLELADVGSKMSYGPADPVGASLYGHAPMHYAPRPEDYDPVLRARWVVESTARWLRTSRLVGRNGIALCENLQRKWLCD